MNNETPKPKYIYWIASAGGSLSCYDTLEEAEVGLQEVKNATKNDNWWIELREPYKCPHCGGWTDLATLQELGMCSKCDHSMTDRER